MKPGFRFLAAGQARISRPLPSPSSPSRLALDEIIRAADLAFTNFENCILGDRGGFPVKEGHGDLPGPEVLDSLTDLGFRALSTANNHAFDLGPEGILATLEAARSRGFLVAGTGADARAAAAPAFDVFSSTKVALVAADASPQPEHFYARDAEGKTPPRAGVNRLFVRQSLRVPAADFDRLREIRRATGEEERRGAKVAVGFAAADEPEAGCLDFYGLAVERGEEVRELRAIDAHDRARYLAALSEAAGRADLVIAYLHHHLWSPAWTEVPEWARDFARDCIGAGASVFVSHGVPLLQGFEVFQGRPIFHGLGNFIFHSKREATRGDPRLWKSLVATSVFDGEGLLDRVDFAPIVIGGEAALGDARLPREAPELAEGGLGASILSDFAARSATFGTGLDLEGARASWRRSEN